MEVIQGFWEAIRTGSLPDLGAWSYVLITILVFVEGPSVTLVAGAMAATGILRPELVFIAAALGNFLSDAWWYALGFFGGNRNLLFRFRWFRERREQLEALEEGMQEHGAKMYLMSKLSMGLLSIPTLVSAGLARVPWYRLIVVSIVVEPLWSGFLVFAGYRLGQHLTQMEKGLQVAAMVGGVVLLLVFLYFYRRMFKRFSQLAGKETVRID